MKLALSENPEDRFSRDVAHFTFWFIYSRCVLSVFACLITFGTLIDACRAYSSVDDETVSPVQTANTESSQKYNLSTVTNQPPPDLHANLYQPLTEKHDKTGSDYAIVNPAFTDSSLTNGGVNPEKAEVEIAMPSGK